MLNKKGIVVYIGKIIKVLANFMFLVSFNFNKEIVCYLCGKMKLNFIKIIVGDLVEVEFSKTSLLKGRIIKRLK